MDVGTISNASAVNVGQSTVNKNSAAKIQSAVGAYANAAKTGTTTDSANAAYAVNISDAAQAMAKDSDETTVDSASADKTQGLAADILQTLTDEQEAQKNAFLNLMIQALTANNENQDKIKSLLGDNDAAKFGLPAIATNPEDAAKAVAEGGDWSVGAVSDRIFGLAEVLAGGDPEKLEQMRAAVEEGFKQAGMEWKDATGNDSMPDITKQTYNEIMKRFDDNMNKLRSGTL